MARKRTITVFGPLDRGWMRDHPDLPFEEALKRFEEEMGVKVGKRAAFNMSYLRNSGRMVARGQKKVPEKKVRKVGARKVVRRKVRRQRKVSSRSLAGLRGYITRIKNQQAAGAKKIHTARKDRELQQTSPMNSFQVAAGGVVVNITSNQSDVYGKFDIGGVSFQLSVKKE